MSCTARSISLKEQPASQHLHNQSSPTKMKLSLTFVLLAVTAAAAYCAGSDKLKHVADGTCQCAVFEAEVAAGEPFIVKTPGFRVACNEEGSTDCQKMCVALAEAAKADAPKILCEAVSDLPAGIKAAVHFKACDAAEWTYSGLTASSPICCAAGLNTPCPKDPSVKSTDLKDEALDDQGDEALDDKGDEALDDKEDEDQPLQDDNLLKPEMDPKDSLHSS